MNDNNFVLRELEREYSEEIQDLEGYESDPECNSECDSEFLENFQNNNYQETPVLTENELHRKNKEAARTMKALLLQQQREIKKEQREMKKELKETIINDKREAKKNKNKNDDNDSISGGDEGTPLLGKTKIILMKKIKQYKSLFPEELTKFKIKKNPNEQDLIDALSEMETLVETNSVDGFLMDSVIQSIKLVENVSSVSKNYDIRGCADLLKSNKQFHSLCKQLFIKYNVFSNVPAEYQLLLLVSTTAYICTNKNKNKDRINDYLNETI
jgi:hypothetical protein